MLVVIITRQSSVIHELASSLYVSLLRERVIEVH